MLAKHSCAYMERGKTAIITHENDEDKRVQVKDLVVTLVSHRLLLMEQGHGFGH